MNKIRIDENRNLLADKEELEEILNRRYLSDEYLIETGRGRTRTSFPMAGDYAYGICMVIDDIAEHWLFRAINAEIDLKQSQDRERVLRAALEEAQEVNVDLLKQNNLYKQKYQDECENAFVTQTEHKVVLNRERVLREALEYILLSHNDGISILSKGSLEFAKEALGQVKNDD